MNKRQLLAKRNVDIFVMLLLYPELRHCTLFGVSISRKEQNKYITEM